MFSQISPLIANNLQYARDDKKDKNYIQFNYNYKTSKKSNHYANVIITYA